MPSRPNTRSVTRAVTRPVTALLTLLLGLVLFTACGPTDAGGPADPSTGSEASSVPSASAAEFPRDVTIGEQSIHLESRPTAIIVLGPALTETVYAVGAGEQVIAVDKLSNYPAEAKTSEIDAFAPNVEAIAGMEPDLVLTTNDQDDIVSKLTALDIPVALLEAPLTLEAAYTQFAQVGELTGHDTEAAELAESVQQRVADAVASVASAEGLKYYWELDDNYFSITSETFIGAVLDEFGLVNIADEAPGADESFGYPQLSAEFIIDADPDVIFTAGGDAEAIRARDGWDVTRAVKDADGVVVIDPDISSRWGPRIAEMAELVAEALAKLQ